MCILFYLSIVRLSVCAFAKQNIGLQIYIVALAVPAIGLACAEQW